MYVLYRPQMLECLYAHVHTSCCDPPSLVCVLGIMAILFCGIVMSHYAHHNLSPVTQITIQQILRTVAFMAGLSLFLCSYVHTYISAYMHAYVNLYEYGYLHNMCTCLFMYVNNYIHMYVLMSIFEVDLRRLPPTTG